MGAMRLLGFAADLLRNRLASVWVELRPDGVDVPYILEVCRIEGQVRVRVNSCDHVRQPLLHTVQWLLSACRSFRCSRWWDSKSRQLAFHWNMVALLITSVNRRTGLPPFRALHAPQRMAPSWSSVNVFVCTATCG